MNPIEAVPRRPRAHFRVRGRLLFPLAAVEKNVSERMTVNERRVYRQVGVPVSAFDVWKALQRAWQMETGAEVLTRLLYEAAPRVGMAGPMMKRDADHAQDTRPRP